MAGFLSYILKHKKIAFSILLFFVAAGILLPTTTELVNAQEPGPPPEKPTITSISPTSVPKGSPAFKLTVDGSDFTPASIVELGFGQAMQTRYISEFRLRADIPAEKIKGEVSYPVSVVNPTVGRSNIVWFNVTGAGDNILNQIFETLKSFTDNFPNNIIIGIIKLVSLVMLWICKTIATYSGQLFVYVQSTFLKDEKWAITRAVTSTGVDTFAGSVFLASWNEVKKWANMLIVLGLLGVAVSTILRFKEYEAKKLLPGILMVALLVNFSVVFVGLMIDASNIAMQSLIGAANGSEESNLVLKINGAWNNTVNKISVINYPSAIKYAGLNFVFNIIYIIVAITLFWFTLIFIERYVILAILFILSPLAFVFFVFPLTRRLWNDWWQHFIKWCFIGIGAAFFLNLATSILVTFSKMKGGFNVESEGDLVRMIFRIFVVMVFLLMGLRLVAKADGIAKIVMAAVAAVVAAIVTGGVSLAGTVGAGAAKATGIDKAGTKVADATRSRITKIGEGLGLVKQGTANKAYQDRQAARMKPYEPLAEAEKDNKVVTDRAMNSNNAAERAAYTKELIKRKKTNLIKDEGVAQNLIENAKAHGIDTDEFINTNPQLARYNKQAVTKEKAALEKAEREKWEKDIEVGKSTDITGKLHTERSKKSLIDLHMKNYSTRQTTQEEAENAAITSAQKKASVDNIREWDTPNFTAESFENIGNKKLRKALENMPNSEEKIRHLKSDIAKKGIAAQNAGNQKMLDSMLKLRDELDALLK